MDILSGIRAGLPKSLYTDLVAYRHQVFVEMLGWELDTPNGYERDQFDRPGTVYVVARDDAQRISGCARPLPTTKLYLLSEVFPELLNGLPPPVCARRLGTLPIRRRRSKEWIRHGPWPDVIPHRSSTSTKRHSSRLKPWRSSSDHGFTNWR